MSRRVAITGVGLVSCLGHDYERVIARLRRGESGIRAVPDWAQFGIKSLVGGAPDGLEEKRQRTPLPKKLVLGMSDAALFCSLAAVDAVADAGLTESELADSRTACIVGSGTGSVSAVYAGASLAYSGRIRRMDPFTVLRCMASSTSAAVANLLKVRGPSYSISSACATSAHNVGHAFQLIRSGAADRAVAGGGEDFDEMVTASFQGLRVALSTNYNETPQRASRPFDSGRDGFVIAGGGGIVVLEELEQARARGARVRAELLGFGASSDGHDLVLPEPTGQQAAACMVEALRDAGVEREEIDYVNAHGTSTVAGDVAEVRALRHVFDGRVPPFSSTKSMTGHAIGAAGVHELIYCVGMLEGGFLAPSINVDNPDPEVDGLPLVTAAEQAEPRVVLTNNFGFGGTNASLVLRRADG